jgi:hypothetical protein
MSQVHHLLLELIPGGAKKDLSEAQAKALLATVRSRDLAGKTRRRVAVELITDLERIYQRKKAAKKELTALVAATGTTLMDLHGIGPSGAARHLVEVGDITRFPDKNHFGSWSERNPSTPPPATTSRHRLSRGGNRLMNRGRHIMATVQLRNPTEGRDFFDRTSGETLGAWLVLLQSTKTITYPDQCLPPTPEADTSLGSEPAKSFSLHCPMRDGPDSVGVQVLARHGQFGYLLMCYDENWGATRTEELVKQCRDWSLGFTYLPT